MSVDFNPRARAVNTGETTSETQTNSAQSQSLDSYDPLLNPPAVVSEMELLFSGTHRLNQLRRENPSADINVPDLGGDILGPLPVLGGSSENLSEVIGRYKGLKQNLGDRRRNLSHALDSGYLRPAEAMDIHQRIEEIDRALIKLEQELEKTTRLKQQRETFERAEAERRIREEQEAEDRARAEWERWNSENN